MKHNYTDFGKVLTHYTFTIQMKRKKKKIIHGMINAMTEEAAREMISSFGFNNSNCNIEMQRA